VGAVEAEAEVEANRSAWEVVVATAAAEEAAAAGPSWWAGEDRDWDGGGRPRSRMRPACKRIRQEEADQAETGKQREPKASIRCPRRTDRRLDTEILAQFSAVLPSALLKELFDGTTKFPAH